MFKVPQCWDIVVIVMHVVCTNFEIFEFPGLGALLSCWDAAHLGGDGLILEFATRMTSHTVTAAVPDRHGPDGGC